MEDQGKRLLLAVAAAMGILLLWQVLFPTKPEEPKPGSGSGSAITAPQVASNPIGQATPSGPGSAAPAPAVGSGSAAPAVGSGSAAPAVGSGSAAPAAPAVAAGPVVHARAAADEITLESPEVTAVFTKWGGNLVSWHLRDERYLTTSDKGELVSGAPFGGADFDVNFVNSPYVIPTGAEWAAARNGNAVTYTYKDDRFAITKTYTVMAADYLIKLDIGVQALGVGSESLQQLAVSTFAYQDPKVKPLHAGRVTREWKALCRVNGEEDERTIPEIFEPGSAKTGPLERGGSVVWSAVAHPYFLVAMAPAPASQGAQVGAQDGAAVACAAYPVATTPGMIQMAMVFGATKLRAGDPVAKISLVAYVGPKYLEKLERADKVAGFPTSFDKTVGLGWFAFIARPLLWLLLHIFDFVGNWGVAIILLTILVKFATLYWTTKSMRSMRAMAALKPQMDALNKKYGSDRARIQTEMMALYKQNGVNPLAGCLPMLLQMPIWLALYKMLSTAGELYNAPFIPGWINDLTQQDPFYILGVALVGMMFLQAKLQPPSGDGMQQKIMMYGLPGIFGVMSLFFPSGLTLYILTNTCLTALHAVYMRKWDKSAKLIVKPVKLDDEPPASKGKPAPAKKRVIDVEEVASPATSTSDADDGDGDGDDDGDDDDSGDDADEGDAPAAKSQAARTAQKTSNRPRRGQRRRGRN
jgi:YidC/Oxa1 family membrane protein insertase